jgi:hypothetical protein
MLISTARAKIATNTTVRSAPRETTTSPATSPSDAVEIGARSSMANAASGAVTVAATANAVLEAFPGFIYPSIHNASAAEQAQIMATLDKLPLNHVSGVDTIEMDPVIPSDRQGWVILGRAHDYGLSNDIHLSRTELTTPAKMEDTLIHEVGHTVDYNHKPYPFGPGASAHHGYGHGGHVTEYAQTNAKEDYAESYQEYHQRPDNLKKVSPEKFADQQRNNHQSWAQQLVDRKEFRETGKFLGHLMGPNKATRQTIETARSGAGALQLANGVAQWAGSASTGNAMQHASGILNTISGAVMLSGVAPLASVGLQAANLSLRRAVKRGDLSGAEVESTISVPVRPIEAAFGRQPARIQDDHRPGKVVAVAAAGALGGTAGAMVGPYAGVIGGYHLAGGLGGAVGLVAGGVLGFLGGTELGSRLGAALMP